MSSNSICQFNFGIKLAHLRNDFTRLQSELICGRNAQTLEETHGIINISVIVYAEMKTRPYDF